MKGMCRVTTPKIGVGLRGNLNYSGLGPLVSIGPLVDEVDPKRRGPLDWA